MTYPIEVMSKVIVGVRDNLPKLPPVQFVVKCMCPTCAESYYHECTYAS